MKQCTNCLQDKPLTLDNFYKRKDGSFESYCRPCSLLRVKEYYKKNKKNQIKKSSAARKARQIITRSYCFDFLKTHPCVDCGETDILTLEFDHLVPSEKENTISMMVSQGMLIEKIKKEMLKCEVRCANCHKKKTSKQQLWYKYLYLEKEKENEQDISKNYVPS